jgi:hypothetical protein
MRPCYASPQSSTLALSHRYRSQVLPAPVLIHNATVEHRVVRRPPPFQEDDLSGDWSPNTYVKVPSIEGQPQKDGLLTLEIPANDMPATEKRLPISNVSVSIRHNIPEMDQPKLKFMPYITECQDSTVNLSLYR